MSDARKWSISPQVLLRTGERISGYLLGISLLVLVVAVLSGATALLSSSVAKADNGQCQWEGGPGAPTHAYCADQDCIGAGGYAQCGQPVIRPPSGLDDEQVDGQDYVYITGDTETFDVGDWCIVEGGTGGFYCTGVNPVEHADGAPYDSNSESLALSTTMAALQLKYQGLGGCTTSVQSDTGWGATSPGGGTYPVLQNGQIIHDYRVIIYGTSCGNGSTAGDQISYQRIRTLVCKQGWDGRTLPSNGYTQCVIPATAVCPKCDPINPVTGAEIQQFVDYKVGGIGGLQFDRYYNSDGAYNYPSEAPAVTGLSSYWHFSYQRHLTPVTDNSSLMAFVQREDGSVEYFDSSGKEILNQTGAADTLRSNGGSGWTLTRGDGATEVYNAGGDLTSITQLNGLEISVSYGTNGQPSGISDSFGHVLNLAYNENGQLVTVTLPDGSSQITYSYGSIGQLTGVTYADGSSLQYQYQDGNNSWLITGIIDESGQQYATYSYSSGGQIASEYQGSGVNRYSISINSADPGQPVYASITDPSGENRQFTYTDATGVYKESGASTYCSDCSNIENEKYDSNGNPTAATDLNGNQTSYTYDDTRNLEISRTEALNGGQPTSATRTITTQWDPTRRLQTQISVYTGAAASGSPLRTTSYTYGTYGNILTRTITDGATGTARTWTYSYENSGKYGQVQSVDGPRTDVPDVIAFTYYDCTTGGGCGQLHTATDALGHTTTYDAYDANGMPLQITDPNGTVTTKTYDLRQRLTSETVGGEKTQYSYYPTGLLKQVTRPDASYLTYIYDTAHRLTAVEDPTGDSVMYTLDGAGHRQQTQILDSSGTLVRASSTVYNELGQLWQSLTSTKTTDSATVYSYDSQGNEVSISEPLQHTIADTYDALNRLHTSTDPAGGLTSYAYDADDDVTSVTDPRGLVTSYTRDGFGDVTQLQSPDSGKATYTYDSAGNVATSLDGRQNNATYTDDALNRVATIQYPDQAVSFAYDQGTDGIGHLTGISDGSGQTTFSYDPLGRVLKETETVNGVNLAVSYGYASGDLVAMTTPSGQALTYGYNSNGQISSITLNGTPLLTSIQYSPFGATTGWSWGNSTQTVRAYDLDGQITDIDSAGTSTYTYNDDGTVGSRSDDTEADYSVTAGTTNVAVSPTSNQIAGTSGALVRTYSYDGAGNTLGTGSATFGYDGAGRLSSETAGTNAAHFAVNALGQRVEKTSSDGTVLFAYDENGHLIGEYGGTGSLIEETVWFGEIPVATLRPNGSGGVDIYYIHTDQLNTPRRITRASDNILVWRWSSDPFGNGFVDEDPQGSGQTFGYNLRFPGQYYDPEAELAYNYHRDYDPELGRYVEPDPIGLKGGSSSIYVYVNDRPLRHVDPTGEGFVDCAKAIGELVKATAVLNGRIEDMEVNAGEEDPGDHGKAIEQAANRVRHAVDKVLRSCGCVAGAAAAIAAGKAALDAAAPYLLEAAAAL